MTRISSIMIELLTMSRLLKPLAVAGIGVLLPLAAAVSPVLASIQGDSMPLSLWQGQTRTTGGGGLTGKDHYSGDDAIQIEWNITDNSDGTYHYEYTFSGDVLTNGTNAISYLTLDISDDAIKDETLLPGVITDPKLVELEVTSDGTTTLATHDASDSIEAGDKDFITGAVKFDIGGDHDDADQYVYRFNSERMPVWGSFYAKNGGGSSPGNGNGNSSNTAYVANNAWFELTGRESFELDNELNWIAVPNGHHIPEPAAFVIWGLLATCGIVLRRWRQR